MKKLLSILAAVGLTATSASSVVACGSSKSKDNTNKTGTSIVQDGDIDLNSSKVLNSLIDNQDFKTVFGDQGVAAKTFMNYFAEAAMNYISKNTSDKNTDKSFNGYTGTLNADAKQYIDTGMFQTIKNDWNTQNQSAKDAWSKLIKAAPDKYGKDWKKKLLKDLQGQLGKTIYDANGKTITPTEYTQYKDAYISNQILNGSANGKSVYDSLKDDIYLWGGTPTSRQISTILSNIRAQVFNKAITVNSKAIDFTKGTKGGRDELNNPTEDSLVGQMKNFIDAVLSIKDKDKATGDDATYLDYLVSMYNITGGLNAETQTDSFNIGKVKWATKKNIFSATELSDSKTAAANLIARFDSQYDSDFGNGSTDSTVTNYKNLTINSKFNLSNNASIQSIYDESQPTQLGSQINGLYSNAQRFVANDYYRTEKPVAVSELVVSPLYGSPDYSQIINNSGYIPSDANAGTQMMTEFYSLIANFINKNAGGSDYSTAHTDKVLDNSSDYSWDQLMTNISSDWPSDANTTNPVNWNADSTFKGKVKFTSHDNLLTVDSSSSDYSDLLKNSVYDYLSGKVSGGDYSWQNPADNSDTIPGMITKEAFDNTINNSPDKTALTTQFNTITNFVDSITRSTDGKSSKKMYQVVNSDQGIISFMDKDGIHFVRIEGYNIINPNTANGSVSGTERATSFADASGITNKQTPLTTSDFDTNDDSKNAFYANQALNNEISNGQTDEQKSAAAYITSDYLSKSTTQAKTAGLSYDDLNKSFGNQYLRFLANSSIPKSLGYSSAKYSYDLNSLLKTYSGSDITADSVTNSSTLTLMVWNYFKELFGMDDTDLFNWVINGGSDTPGPSSKTQDNIFAPINQSTVDDTTKTKFKDFYKKYIIDGILGKYTDDGRASKSDATLSKDWQTADQTIEQTAWKDPTMAKYNPSLEWQDSGGTKATYYQDRAKALDESDIWKYDNTASKFPDQQVSTARRFNITSSSVFKYKMDMSKFVNNEFAFKGDED